MTQDNMPQQLKWATGGAVLLLVGMIAGAALIKVGGFEAFAASRDSTILPTARADRAEDLMAEIAQVRKELDRIDSRLIRMEAGHTASQVASAEIDRLTDEFAKRFDRLEQALSREAAVPSQIEDGKVEVVRSDTAESMAMEQGQASQDPPADSGGKSGEEPSSAEGAEESPGQCTAITQKGTRCKRNATNGGRCWQHDD